MRRQKFLMGGLALLAAFSMSACGTGIRQSSAASDEDSGRIHVEAPQDKPLTYTTQAGDTLVVVAARPEIYGDPDLWPLLQDANAEILKGKSADSGLDADLVLEIPRGSTPEVLDSARARARQFAADLKARAAARKAAALHAGAAVRGAASGAAVAIAAPPTAAPTSAAPEPTGGPTAEPEPLAAAAPSHPSKSKMLPLLLLLALVLAALGAVFIVFFRRDKRDFD